ncbi:MAG: hypothetical protein PWP23_1467 [Candidatus Sumerlaeota bacterium]|nr:hypothetical protein [Candidatus Sumerlaeota bacterium]
MDWITQHLGALADSPLAQGALVAASTLIFEDAATLASGLLVASGELDFTLALVGLCVGIVVSDMGLYLIGRFIGLRLVAWGIVQEERLLGPSEWLRRNLLGTVIVSRFIPGSRTATYMAAGALKAPFWKFAACTIVAVVPWVIGVLWLTAKLGEAAGPLLGNAKWPVAGGVLLMMVAVQWGIGRRRKARLAKIPESDRPKPVISFFEFWPPWLFYAPVAVYCAGLSLRHYGITLPTCANPSIHTGGWIGESKTQILSLIPRTFERFLLRHVLFRFPEHDVPAAAEEALAAAGLAYPFVAKPDEGQRGAGVRVIRDAAALHTYLEDFPPEAPVVFQELADFEHEAGVFYVRHPGEEHGRILSITSKVFPHVTGDGIRTLKELVEADPRARFLKEKYLSRNSLHLDRVLGEGERFRLVFSGNHCQGAIFRDGIGLATPALTETIDEIARAMPGFFFGRFDLRYADEAAFRRGEEFKIVEVNGASSECTHIWDANMRLRDAYRVLFQQFRLLYEIGAENRRRGARPTGLADIVRETRTYFRTARNYPFSS